MIALSEVQASLSLFAESLAGGPVAFSILEDAAQCWPVSDAPIGHGVILPAEAADRPTFRTLVLHRLLWQVTEGTEQQTELFDRVLQLVESHRVNAHVRRHFPGASKDLQVLLDQAADQLSSAGPSSDSSTDAALHALRLYSFRWNARARPEVAHAAALLDEVHAVDATGHTSVRVAHTLCEHLGAPVGSTDLGMPLPELEPDPEAEGLPSEATTGVSLDGGTPSEIVEGDHQGGGQLSTDLAEHDFAAADPAIDEQDTPAPGIELPRTRTTRPLPAKTRTYVYDEWDYHQGTHRAAWCRVTEEQLVGSDHDFIVDVRRRHQALRTRVRQQMLKLPAQQLERVHRSLDGDELDLDAAIEAVVDRRSGAPVDDRLQIRRDRAARDVATAFLVDLSASTSSPSVPPEPVLVADSGDPMDDPMSYGPIWDAPRVVEPVRKVIDVAKDAVTLMADALHELGDMYAVYGFSGTGRENVEFKIGKDFADRTSASSWASIGAMKPLRYTRMGPAVRHTAAKLGGVAARTKLLIVVSDGYPQDVDYGHDRNDRDYGMFDTARALQDATDAGIETFCVTIDPAGHDYLRDMCPDGRYLVIDDVESLPEELAKLYLLTMSS